MNSGAHELDIVEQDLLALLPRHVHDQIVAERLDQEGTAAGQFGHAVDEIGGVIEMGAHGPFDEAPHILAVQRPQVNAVPYIHEPPRRVVGVLLQVLYQAVAGLLLHDDDVADAGALRAVHHAAPAVEKAAVQLALEIGVGQCG